ncbi:thiamine kinase [Vibrio cincinnatiensis]|uniref:phosphotransferase n=1 Tax=Vibrio cincinnatiensis TaxID=675 RepID=UPI001EDECC9C|nr:phosphotransferase [Vibrio cincinnatiensis]MCG3758707.1 thiamine kinase [Vibrio cincinnatiensis]MCG3762013.1 thiamine kinase [Vibrio cincinnatiensis]MCG3766756.1 thiamine kinase [Vibrio cincinnatiensis]
MARMSWREACQLDPTLQSLTHFFTSTPEYAQTLTGGLTNRCWKITHTADQVFVWRPITLITKGLSISRAQEYQILKAIESSHLGPKAVVMNDQGLLVEWIAGKSQAEESVWESILKVLVQIHQLETSRIPVPPFNYTARVDHYWLHLKPDVKSSPFEPLYQQWRTMPNCASLPLTLCHFDLAGYNLIKTEAGFRAIDWEYASIADPRLDLAISIDVAGEKLLDAVFRYCQLRNIQQVDSWIEGVKAWQPRVRMMAMLWYLLAYQLWGGDEYYQQALRFKEQLIAEHPLP